MSVALGTVTGVSGVLLVLGLASAMLCLSFWAIPSTSLSSTSWPDIFCVVADVGGLADTCGGATDGAGEAGTDVGAAIGRLAGGDVAGVDTERLAIHSSKNVAAGLAVGRGDALVVGGPKGLADERFPAGGPKGPPAGLGCSLIAIRPNISSSTTALGLPYLANDSCFNAAANLRFGVPIGGTVAILNG